MIVCADDFGIADDVNRAIVDLAGQKRISAASCMVALPGFDRAMFDKLLAHAGHLDIGLHLTFTDTPLVYGMANAASPGVMALLRRSLYGQMAPGDIACEIAAQYELFTDHAGRPPDYLDSHLHVHQFPGISAGLMQFLQRMDPVTGPYVRNSAMTVRKIIRQGVSPLKCLAIGLFGACFSRRLVQQGWKTNQGFAGIYAYSGYRSYPLYLDRFVSCMESPNGILMTHPGEVDNWRRMEYRTLSEAFCLDGRINRYLASARKSSCK